MNRMMKGKQGQNGLNIPNVQVLKCQKFQRGQNHVQKKLSINIIICILLQLIFFSFKWDEFKQCII